MTNVTDPHTFTVVSVDLVFAMIFLLHGDLLEFVGDVVGSTTVNIPVCVNSIGAISRRGNFLFILRGVTVIFFIAVPIVLCRMARLATNLAARQVRTGPVGTTTATTTAPFGVTGAPAAA